MAVEAVLLHLANITHCRDHLVFSDLHNTGKEEEELAGHQLTFWSITFSQHHTCRCQTAVIKFLIKVYDFLTTCC